MGNSTYLNLHHSHNERQSYSRTPRQLTVEEYSLALKCFGLCQANQCETSVLADWQSSLSLSSLRFFKQTTPLVRFLPVTAANTHIENVWQVLTAISPVAVKNINALFGDEVGRGPFAVHFHSKALSSPRDVSHAARIEADQEHSPPKSPLHDKLLSPSTTTHTHGQEHHSTTTRHMPCVCFRGLNGANDSAVDLQSMLPAKLCSSENGDGDAVDGEAALGFLRLYHTLCSVPAEPDGEERETQRVTVREELQRSLSTTHSNAVLLCGHGVGGALATLFAAELAFDPRFAFTRIVLVTFGSPRCVDLTIAGALEAMPNLRHYRFVNANDFVTVSPLSIAGFSHFGHAVYPLRTAVSEQCDASPQAMLQDKEHFVYGASHHFQGFKWHVVYETMHGQSTRQRDFSACKDLCASAEHFSLSGFAPHKLDTHIGYYGALRWHDPLLFERLTAHWPMTIHRDRSQLECDGEFVKSCVTTSTSDNNSQNDVLDTVK